MLELLADNLTRFNESEETDRQGVFQILGIFENMIAITPLVVIQLTEKTRLMKWLLERISLPLADANRAYSAELLSIILQQVNTSRKLFGKLGGVEIVLKACSVCDGNESNRQSKYLSTQRYRKHNPEDADEMEFMDNLFNLLCASFNEPENLIAFRECEGVDLMVLMIK